jgi:RHS repeat-associated protein
MPSKRSRQRVKKSGPLGTVYFVYDEAGHLIGEYDANGDMIQEIVWMGETPIATMRWSSCGLAIFYIHTDHLNTPRRITKRSEPTIVWRWDSDPFGSTPANENPDNNGTLFVFNLRFPGQYFDAETGLHYNYFRDYDPVTGRYVESDPIGLRGGLNTFEYVGANPIFFNDPLGLAIGDLPPNPPGYDPQTWGRGVWDSGTPYVKDPSGRVWTAHPEDTGHWRHWDVDGDDNKGNRWPPNSKKPWPNQKRGLKKDQCATDPNGDAPPWEPPADLMVPWLAPEYAQKIPESFPIGPRIRFRIPLRVPVIP